MISSLQRQNKTAATEICLGNKVILYSYSTPVAVHIEGQGYFKTATKYSVTTSKHVTQWLNKMRVHSVKTVDQTEFNRLIQE